MKIAIASDHAGFSLKKYLLNSSYPSGISFIDLGTNNEEPVDYPDFAKNIAISIINKECVRGIIVCGSGIGASIAANKFKGIRASVCHDTYSAHQGVEHDDMNVLSLGARVIGVNLSYDIVLSFLQAKFSNEARHIRRLSKIKSFE